MSSWTSAGDVQTGFNKLCPLAFREFSLDASVEMPHEISSLTCVTHGVKTKVAGIPSWTSGSERGGTDAGVLL